MTKILASPRKLKTLYYQISRLLSVFRVLMMIQIQACQNLLMTLDMAEYWLDLTDGVTKDGETENFVCIDALMKNLG